MKGKLLAQPGIVTLPPPTSPTVMFFKSQIHIVDYTFLKFEKYNHAHPSSFLQKINPS